MTIAPKSLALAAVLMAQSTLFGSSPAFAIPIGFPDVSFPDVETRESCYFFGNCEGQQTVTKQQSDATYGSAAPKTSPLVSSKGDR